MTDFVSQILQLEVRTITWRCPGIATAVATHAYTHGGGACKPVCTHKHTHMYPTIIINEMKN